MNIAIIGLADSCLSDAPVDDSEGWAGRWHMGQDLWAAGATDVFEMHERKHWGKGDRLDYLRRTQTLVWTRDLWTDLPTCKPYPVCTALMAAGLKEPYFECTAAYMLAYAIALKPERIGLWGISGEDEYRQRANLEYLIGVARGRGIEVWIHPNSDLFTSQWESGSYGWQDPKEAA